MQIHEITYSRVNESILKGVTNAIKRAPAVAGAVASNIGGQILAKAGMDANTGLGTTNPFGDKEAEAAKLAEPLIKNQAASLQKKWAAADHSNPATTQQSLNRVLHNTLLQRKIGNDYNELNAWVDPDPAIQQRAATIEKQIETAMKTITNAGSKADEASWEALVRAASQAMQLISFHPKKYSASSMLRITSTPAGWTIGNTVLSPNNPAHAPIIQMINAQQQQTGSAPKLKQTPQGLMIGPQLVGRNNPAFQTLSNIVNGTSSSAGTSQPPGNAPTNGQPTGPATNTTTSPQQSKIRVGQINKVIPSLRTRDLLSVKKNVDKTLATKQKTTAPASNAAPPATKPTWKGKQKNLTKQQQDYIKAINARQPESMAEQRNAK